MRVTRWVGAAIVAAGAAGVAGCADEKAGPIAVSADVGAIHALAPIIDDGMPSYYEYNTTISGSGGLPPDWVNAQESHSRTFKEIYRWAAVTGTWDVENQFATAEQEFTNFVQSEAVDVAKAVKSYNAVRSTNRLGSTVSQSSRPAIDLVQQGYGPVANRLPAEISLSQAAAQAAFAASPPAGPEFTPDEVRASRSDRIVVTANGSDRELKLLRKQFKTERDNAARETEFEGGTSTHQVRVHFNKGIGAVTRVVSLENGRKQSEIVRKYRRDGRFWVLESIETRLFDENGKPTQRFTEVISDIQVQ